MSSGESGSESLPADGTLLTARGVRSRAALLAVLADLLAGCGRSPRFALLLLLLASLLFMPEIQ